MGIALRAVDNVAANVESPGEKPVPESRGLKDLTGPGWARELIK